jgi:hypothetical protein
MGQTMLYRPTSEPNPHIEGRRLEHLVVDDKDIEAAQKDGWSRLRDLPADDEAEEEKPKRGRPPKAAE